MRGWVLVLGILGFFGGGLFGFAVFAEDAHIYSINYNDTFPKHQNHLNLA